MTTRVLALALVLSVGSWSSAAGDWLVTVDGARIETKGPWKVKGNQVVFTLANGTLSTIRKSEVDLDASAAATAESEAPAQPEATEGSRPQERPKATKVFNNKNIRAAAEPAGVDREQEPEGRDAAPVTSSGSVELVSWTSRDSSSGDGLEIVGTVKNQGRELAANISVKVIVVDETGAPVVDTTAFMRSTGLVPGKSTTFRALLPGIFTLFHEPRFEVQSGSFTVKPEPENGDEPAAEPGEGR